MTASSSSAKEPHARAWLFCAQFDVEVHMRLASSDTDKIFPEYLREVDDTRKSYPDARLEGLDLLTYSLPTRLYAQCAHGWRGMSRAVKG